jgi:KTSC domain
VKCIITHEVERESGDVKAIRYAEAEQAMYVTFARGATYRYTGVTLDHFRGVLASESVGKCIATVIKPVCPCVVWTVNSGPQN